MLPSGWSLIYLFFKKKWDYGASGNLDHAQELIVAAQASGFNFGIYSSPGVGITGLSDSLQREDGSINHSFSIGMEWRVWLRICRVRQLCPALVRWLRQCRGKYLPGMRHTLHINIAFLIYISLPRPSHSAHRSEGESVPNSVLTIELIDSISHLIPVGQRPSAISTRMFLLPDYLIWVCLLIESSRRMVYSRWVRCRPASAFFLVKKVVKTLEGIQSTKNTSVAWEC